MLKHDQLWKRQVVGSWCKMDTNVYFLLEWTFEGHTNQWLCIHSKLPTRLRDPCHDGRHRSSSLTCFFSTAKSMERELWIMALLNSFLDEAATWGCTMMAPQEPGAFFNCDIENTGVLMQHKLQWSLTLKAVTSFTLIAMVLPSVDHCIYLRILCIGIPCELLSSFSSDKSEQKFFSAGRNLKTTAKDNWQFFHWILSHFLSRVQNSHFIITYWDMEYLECRIFYFVLTMTLLLWHLPFSFHPISQILLKSWRTLTTETTKWSKFRRPKGQR